VGAPRDTIVALATPPGRGGIGVIRVSGPLAATIAREILGELPPHRPRSPAKMFSNCTVTAAR
jgi:tRNA modification GTPase